MKSQLRQIFAGINAFIYRRLLHSHVEKQILEHFLARNHIFGGPYERVRIHPSAGVIGVFFNVSSGTITVEEYASISNGAMLITGSHDISQQDLARQEAYPRQGRDIHVGRGAWICSGAIVLGPCRIGEQAVVGAGAVVRADVPSHSVVAGVPAKVVKHTGISKIP
jgi:acetyltransferase-like isoleucine patch superfamily enzyme